MPRLPEGERRRLESQISGLLDQAAERPGPQDGLGMVGFHRALLAAGLWSLNETSKACEREARAELVAALQARIQAWLEE